MTRTITVTVCVLISVALLAGQSPTDTPDAHVARAALRVFALP